MDLENIKSFIKLAKSEGVSELKYEQKDLKISVKFSVAETPTAQAYVPSVAPQVQVGGSSEQTSDPSLHEVKSPFVGTFYSKPSPDKQSYVSVGSKISKGQTLCILEAMKIMNEIESDISGEIVEICVDDESLVEFGQVLYRVRA